MNNRGRTPLDVVEMRCESKNLLEVETQHITQQFQILCFLRIGPRTRSFGAPILIPPKARI